jgi:hypothetical protein
LDGPIFTLVSLIAGIPRLYAVFLHLARRVLDFLLIVCKMGYMVENIFVVENPSVRKIASIFSRIDFNNKTGCWDWTGNLNQTGYGRVRYKGEKILLHRFMYSWLKQQPLSKVISRDVLILDHICNNKRCCNPSHLRLTTHKVNMLRGNGPSAREARQTHCKNGHLLPEKNARGRRNCRICHTIWARERYRRVHNLPPEKFKV